MSFSLDSLVKPETKPPIITIYGDGGTGKTTLASLLPRPVFINIEDGAQSVVGSNAFVTPLCKGSEDVFNWISIIAKDGRERFDTIVFDTVTRFGEIVDRETVEAADKTKNMNTVLGGYGAGHKESAKSHFKLRDWCTSLRDALGFNIVFLAHASISTITLPDADPYNMYTLNLNKESIPAYTNNVDLVGLLRLKAYTQGEGKIKKASSGGIELLCHKDACSVSKNRYKIKAAMPVDEGTNPLADIITSLQVKEIK